tara:strand:+ start:18403 stop:19116 length:714 start_codon:yes stop_codon:yes gene_type:complete
MNLANPFEKWFQPNEKLEGKSLMDHLFNRLDGLYPGKWKRDFPNQQAIDNWQIAWSEAFEDEGIRPIDIKAGLKVCRAKYDWPPSCPEFVKACRPSVDHVVAYHEAIAGMQARAKGEMGRWTHPAIFWAAASMTYDLLEQSYGQVKTQWGQAMMEQMSKSEWAEIPKPMLALPAPGKTKTDREQADKMLKQYKVEVTPKNNHRRWIDNVLKRAENGDKYLPGISVRFAKEASKVAAE